jgi:signal peptidase
MSQGLFSIYQITSGSMEPTLHVGARVITVPVHDFEKGDIITFRDNNGHVVTHTYVGDAQDGSLTTKGDANPTPDVFDRPLQKSDVIGRVVLTTPVLVGAFWLSPRGLAVGLLIIVILALILSMKKKDDKKDLSDETPVQENALTH